MLRRWPVSIVVLALLVAAASTAAIADDAELAARLSERLNASADLDGGSIDVAVHDGVAVLSGTVPRLDASWLARDLAEQTPGLRDVKDRLTVDRRGRGDDDVRAEVVSKLRNVPELAALDLSVGVRDGVVTVGGAIPDARLRFTVREIVGSVAGAVGWADRLASPAADDDAIRLAVRSVLDARALPPGPGGVDASVDGGIVTLSGTVPTPWARTLAERRVLGVNGVRGVVDRIEVGP